MDDTLIITILGASGLWSVILKLVDYWINSRKKETVEGKALGALLRHAMYDIYENYKSEESVPADVQEEMDSLHEAYHALGYNHMGDKIHHDIMAKQTWRP